MSILRLYQSCLHAVAPLQPQGSLPGPYTYYALGKQHSIYKCTSHIHLLHWKLLYVLVPFSRAWRPGVPGATGMPFLGLKRDLFVVSVCEQMLLLLQPVAVFRLQSVEVREVQAHHNYAEAHEGQHLCGASL
jgi:hypothetical protein